MCPLVYPLGYFTSRSHRREYTCALPPLDNRLTPQKEHFMDGVITTFAMGLRVGATQDNLEHLHEGALLNWSSCILQ